MKREALSLGIMAVVIASSMAMAPAVAEARHWDGGHRDGWHDRGYEGRGGYDGSGYGRGYYGYHHRCHSGTGGAIIGAIAGGLLGNSAAGYGDRAAGTIIGGGLGALAGNAIARDC